MPAPLYHTIDASVADTGLLVIALTVVTLVTLVCLNFFCGEASAWPRS